VLQKIGRKQSHVAHWECAVAVASPIQGARDLTLWRGVEEQVWIDAAVWCFAINCQPAEQAKLSHDIGVSAEGYCASVNRYGLTEYVSPMTQGPLNMLRAMRLKHSPTETGTFFFIAWSAAGSSAQRYSQAIQPLYQ
jgi:hypothetical protein